MQTIYQIMDAEAKTSPIGANRLLYLPYLMGERTPHLDPAARGMFFGLSAIHGRPDLIRAVLEGVAFSLRDCTEIFREMGIDTSGMILCGGGAKSPLWAKIIADVYHTDVRAIPASGGGAFGAAILAGVGAGLLVDKGTAYLRGGRITANKAYRAAGVFVGNEGVAYVSGDLFVKNNTKTSGDVARSDFVVEERGQLYLDGDLTGQLEVIQFLFETVALRGQIVGPLGVHCVTGSLRFGRQFFQFTFADLLQLFVTGDDVQCELTEIFTVTIIQTVEHSHVLEKLGLIGLKTVGDLFHIDRDRVVTGFHAGNAAFAL